MFRGSEVRLKRGVRWTCAWEILWLRRRSLGQTRIVTKIAGILNGWGEEFISEVNARRETTVFICDVHGTALMETKCNKRVVFCSDNSGSDPLDFFVSLCRIVENPNSIAGFEHGSLEDIGGARKHEAL